MGIHRLFYINKSKGWWRTSPRQNRINLCSGLLSEIVQHQRGNESYSTSISRTRRFLQSATWQRLDFPKRERSKVDSNYPYGGFHWVVAAYGFFNRSCVMIYDSASLQINHRQWEQISLDDLVRSHVLDTVSCLMRADFQVARMACQTQTGGSACGFCLGFHYVFGFWGWSVFDGIWAIPSCKTSIKLLTEERNGMIPIVDEEIAETREYGGGEAISSSGYL